MGPGGIPHRPDARGATEGVPTGGPEVLWPSSLGHFPSPASDALCATLAHAASNTHRVAGARASLRRTSMSLASARATSRRPCLARGLQICRARVCRDPDPRKDSGILVEGGAAGHMTADRCGSHGTNLSFHPRAQATNCLQPPESPPGNRFRVSTWSLARQIG